jgi:hypothetical protein
MTGGSASPTLRGMNALIVVVSVLFFLIGVPVAIGLGILVGVMSSTGLSLTQLLG